MTTTTEQTELVNDLRYFGEDDGFYGPMCLEAADLIESQSRRIAELEAEVSALIHDIERHVAIASSQLQQHSSDVD